MQFIELQDAFAQLEVAVEEGDMLADGLNQVIVNTNRDVVPRKGVFTTGVILALCHVEHVSFHLRRQRRCNCIALLQECAMQALEGIFPYLPLRAPYE